MTGLVISGTRRLVVAVSGASGAAYGLRILELLRATPGWESHLIVSSAGILNIREELGLALRDFEQAADVVHNIRNIGATIASGSFEADGMVIAPCSMKTLSAVANGYADNLITRAADVMLKERRRLVLMARETPLNLAHIRNMETVTLMGGVIFPPVPALYARPGSVADIIGHSAMRVLDLFGIRHTPDARWQGVGTQDLSRTTEVG